MGHLDRFPIIRNLVRTRQMITWTEFKLKYHKDLVKIANRTQVTLEDMYDYYSMFIEDVGGVQYVGLAVMQDVEQKSCTV